MKNMSLPMTLSLCLGLSFALPAFAEPVSVLLHPGGALVREETKLTPETGKKTVRVTLPPTADPQSLDIDVPGFDIAALRFEDVLTPEQGVVGALRQQLEAVRRAIQEKINARADLKARYAFWRSPSVRFSTAAPVAELDALMRKNLAELQKEDIDQTAALENLQIQAKLLEQRLQFAGGNQPTTKQVVIELAETKPGPISVHYAYLLNAAGWRPLYRLDARPAAAEKSGGNKGEVRLSLDAEIWQYSGQDWTGIPLTLSTANPRQGMNPPRLNEWIVQPQPTVQRNQRVSALPEAPVAEIAADAMDAKDDAQMDRKMVAMPAPAPMRMDGTAFESWDMGKRDVPAGPPQRLTLAKETLPAEFAYLIRPSLAAKAFLSAKLTLPDQRHFPPGEATFSVDGMTMGKAPFSLNNNEDWLSFGLDPQVSVEMRNNSQQGGKQGIIDRKQTYDWDWTITVRNAHGRNVPVRVEEAAPQSRDEKITVSMTSEPKPVEEKHVLVWALDVPAKKSVEIRHRVTMTAPADMTVWKGR